jgi:hypothetical protein
MQWAKHNYKFQIFCEENVFDIQLKKLNAFVLFQIMFN